MAQAASGALSARQIAAAGSRAERIRHSAFALCGRLHRAGRQRERAMLSLCSLARSSELVKEHAVPAGVPSEADLVGADILDGDAGDVGPAVEGSGGPGEDDDAASEDASYSVMSTTRCVGS